MSILLGVAPILSDLCLDTTSLRDVTLLVLYYHAGGKVEHVYSILKKYKFAFISRI